MQYTIEGAAGDKAKQVRLMTWNTSGKLKKLKRDLPSRCLIGILPRHQSVTKELHGLSGQS